MQFSSLFSFQALKQSVLRSRQPLRLSASFLSPKLKQPGAVIHYSLDSKLRDAPSRLWPPLPPWNRFLFPTINFPVYIPQDRKVEEETCPDYCASNYYPARIGDIIQNRYQIVGKLGYGTTSTVWLARDQHLYRHVVLKIYMHSCVASEISEAEMEMYKRMNRDTKHPGSRVVRSLLDSFRVKGPDGEHQCLVHQPLWEDLYTFLKRDSTKLLPKELAASTLYHLFLALDFIHRECGLIHTDIKADNIMFGMKDDNVFKEFEKEEFLHPSPRKFVGERLVYQSRQFNVPKEWGMRPPVLCDFGGAVLGDMKYMGDVQPRRYRAPEVMIGVPWGYSIDIWNVGCLIWEIFQGEKLFSGYDVETGTYSHRAHLAEIISLLGPPPPNLIWRGRLSRRFFTKDGEFSACVPIPDKCPLENRETNLTGEDRLAFLRLMRKMLEWDPDKRAPAKELLNDEWIRNNR